MPYRCFFTMGVFIGFPIRFLFFVKSGSWMTYYYCSTTVTTYDYVAKELLKFEDSQEQNRSYP